MKKIVIFIICLLVMNISNMTNVLAETNEFIEVKENNHVNYIDSNKDEIINTGDIITIGTESFYVIKYDEESKTINMLSEKLVDIHTNLQSDTAGSIQYSSDSKYYNGSPIQGYVTKYVDKLNELYNIEATGTLMDKNTCNALGGNYQNGDLRGCPSWLTNYSYWTRSYFVASYGDTVGVVNGTSYIEVNYTNRFGLRPVITISASLLDTYKISVNKTTNGSILLFNDEGEITVVTIPNIGYEVDTISVVGKDNYEYLTTKNDDGTYKFTFDKTHGEVGISATFKKAQYEIKINSVAEATVTPNEIIKIDYEESQDYTIKANKGYKVTSVLVNGEEKVSTLKDDTLTIANITENTNIIVIVEAIQYEFTKGQNSTYNKNDSTGLEFISNGELELFNKLYINNIELNESNYIWTNEGTGIILKDEYLKTLDAGTYALKIEYINGTNIETIFTIVNTQNDDQNKTENKTDEILSNDKPSINLETNNPNHKDIETLKENKQKNKVKTYDQNENIVLFSTLAMSISIVGLTYLKKKILK